MNDLPDPGRPITQAESRCLRFIDSYIKTRGHSPALSEIAGGLQYRTRTTARELIGALEVKGFIRRTPGVARSIVIINSQEAA